MPSQKVTIEIEILQRTLDQFKAKVDQLEKKLNLLGKSKKTVKIEADVKDAERELSKFQNLLNKIGVNSSNIESFKKLGEVLSGLAVKLKDMGKEFIEEALNIKGYENAIIRLSKSTEEGQKTIDFINKLALSSQEFSLESLYIAGKHLSNFKLDVEKLLPLISDFADVYGVDVSKASLMFSKALVGTRGGLTSLMTNFGITREELRKFGAEFTNTGVIVPQSAKSIEATMKLLIEYSKKAGKQGEDTAEKFENAVAKYNNSLQLTKIAIGKELLPVITSLMEKISEITVKFSELTIEQKKNIANITLLAGSTVIAGQAITALIPVVNGLRIAWGLMSSAIAFSPIGAASIIIGGIIYSLEEFYKAVQKAKSERIERSLEPVEEKLRSINNIINEINKNPLEINTEKAKIALDELRDKSRELQVNEQGSKEFDFKETYEGQSLYSIPDPNRISNIEITKGLSIEEVYQRIDEAYQTILEKKKQGVELSDKEKISDRMISDILTTIDGQLKGFNVNQDAYNQKLIDTKKRIEDISPALQNLSSLVEKAFSGLNAGMTAVKEKIDTPSSSSKEPFMPGASEADISKEVSHKISYQKKLIEAGQSNYNQFAKWIDSFTGKYELSNEDLLELQAERNQAQEKINQHEERQLKKQEKTREDAFKSEEKDFDSRYKLFKKDIDQRLKSGKINEDAYFRLMGDFTKKPENQKFISPELAEEINLNNVAINDRRNERESDEAIKQNEKLNKLKEDEQKKNETALEKKKQAELEINRIIAENSQRTSELQIKNENDTVENFIKNEELKFTTLQDKLNKKIEELRKSGVAEIEVRRLINSEVELLQAESLNSFREKEKEKQTVIEETKVEITKLEKELKKLKDEKEAIQNKGSFLTGEDSPLISMEEALKTTSGHFDSYQEKFAEEKKIDEEIKTVEDQKQSLKIKEMEASKALAILKENEAVATGEVVTALNTFAKSLDDASSSSSSSSGGGAGQSSGDNDNADNEGFQNTYSGTMQDLKSSSGDSTMNNPILGAGDSKNNKRDNAQIGDYTEQSTAGGAAGGAVGSGIEEQNQRKKKSKKRLQDYMNMGGGHGGNMPDSSSTLQGNTGSTSGNLPQNVEQEFGWSNPSLDAKMRETGGKWAIGNMRAAINKSSEDMFKNFFQGAAGKMRDFNKSLTSNNINNSRSHQETNNNQIIHLSIDGKTINNNKNQEFKKSLNSVVSLSLAAKNSR